MGVTDCSVGSLGAGVPLLHGLKLLWAEAPYWPRASCLPYLLVDLHSWLPQVLQAQPLQVKHHQHRLDLPAQLRGTEQVHRSDRKCRPQRPGCGSCLPATPTPGCLQCLPSRCTCLGSEKMLHLNPAVS